MSDPLNVKLPALVAVAEAKSVADAVAAVARLNVPPLTAVSEVVPAFKVKEPETTFAMALLPVPLRVKEPPSSEPLNVATPPTLTVPWVNALVRFKFCPKVVVPVPYRLPMLTVPLLEPKLSSALLFTVVNFPLLVENNPELNPAEPELTINNRPFPKSVPTLRVPPLTFTVPVKAVRVPPKVRVPPELNVPPPPR